MVEWLKAQPVIYRWTNGAGGQPLAMKMIAVNHKPMIRLEGTIAF
jgi:putative transposase